MLFLRNPIEEQFYTLCKESKESIELCAPFVKEDIIKKIIKCKDDQVKISLVTNLNTNHVYSKSLDTNALREIINDKGKVYNRGKLHAKFYIFDGKKAIITSGNLTYNGLSRNYEYGVLLEEDDIEEVINDYAILTQKDEATGEVKIKDLQKIDEIVKRIVPVKHKIKDDNHLYLTYKAISPKLSGWNKAVFNVVDRFENDYFELKDFNEYYSILRKKYPRNNNVEAKVRQVLQHLRDLGLINFLGNGCYQRLWIKK